MKEAGAGRHLLEAEGEPGSLVAQGPRGRLEGDKRQATGEPGQEEQGDPFPPTAARGLRGRLQGRQGHYTSPSETVKAGRWCRRRGFGRERLRAHVASWTGPRPVVGRCQVASASGSARGGHDRRGWSTETRSPTPSLEPARRRASRDTPACAPAASQRDSARPLPQGRNWNTPGSFPEDAPPSGPAFCCAGLPEGTQVAASGRWLCGHAGTPDGESRTAPGPGSLPPDDRAGVRCPQYVAGRPSLSGFPATRLGWLDLLYGASNSRRAGVGPAAGPKGFGAASGACWPACRCPTAGALAVSKAPVSEGSQVGQGGAPAPEAESLAPALSRSRCRCWRSRLSSRPRSVSRHLWLRSRVCFRFPCWRHCSVPDNPLIEKHDREIDGLEVVEALLRQVHGRELRPAVGGSQFRAQTPASDVLGSNWGSVATVSELEPACPACSSVGWGRNRPPRESWKRYGIRRRAEPKARRAA